MKSLIFITKPAVMNCLSGRLCTLCLNGCLLLLFLSGYTQSLSGQQYLNETSRWKQYFRFDVYPPGWAFTEDVMIQLDGDTMIGDTKYFRVLKTGRQIDFEVQGNDTLVNHYIHRYLDPIREEGPFIYAYNMSSGQDYLLYDFSGEVGDTLTSGNCKWDTITNIDTLYPGDRPRREFHLNFPTAEICTFVEGIGPTFGLFWQPCNVVPAPDRRLQCYFQDGDVIQFDPGFDCQGLLLADDLPEPDNLTIYPNPFHEGFEVHFSQQFPDPVFISLVNLMGEIVFESKMESPRSVEQVQPADLPAGLYVVCVRGRHLTSTVKLIKL